MLVPGDREVNEEKLARLHFPERVRPFEDEDFAQRGFAKGFVGPQGLGDDVTIFADLSIRGRTGWATGANRTDVHVTGRPSTGTSGWIGGRTSSGSAKATGVPSTAVGSRSPDRSSSATSTSSARTTPGARGDVPGRGRDPQAVRDGLLRDRDRADHGGGRRAAPRRRRDRLAEAARPLRGGRDHGQRRRSEVAREAERIHRELAERGIEAMDDRTEQAGVKFADADLVGYPVQVVVGSRGLDAGTVDLKVRATGERSRPYPRRPTRRTPP